MNYLNPIFTEKRECQDCYKCVRNCPVKAIKVEGGYASVVAELCIYCGQCVEVCPSGAKRVRDDLAAARQLLAQKKPVYVSLAPSYVTEFPGLSAARMIAALRRLGFYRRVGNGPGRATGLGAGGGAAAAAAGPRAGLLGLSHRGGLFAKASRQWRGAAHRADVAPADSLPDAAAGVRRGHRHCLHRPVHRQKTGSRATPGVARRGAHV